MLQKVRFRLVFNRARRLNRQGEGLVQIECSQGGRTIERLSTKIGQNGTVNQVLHRLLSAVGIDEDYTFHTARHTFAQMLLHQEITMTAIQQMLGHRKLETTQIYGERDRVTLLAEMRKSMNSKSKAK